MTTENGYPGVVAKLGVTVPSPFEPEGSDGLGHRARVGKDEAVRALDRGDVQPALASEAELDVADHARVVAHRVRDTVAAVATVEQAGKARERRRVEDVARAAGHDVEV